eukprot:GABW01003320.1.p2 GENE.GABW01003320.1~~GABW01003320.1.p2  ORF type:complete len:51 (+),score=18.57 GABW01003320.1:201-353(+)
MGMLVLQWGLSVWLFDRSYVNKECEGVTEGEREGKEEEVSEIDDGERKTQ